MSAPIGQYNDDEALRMGRELEKLNASWYDELLYDIDLYNLKKLSQELSIPAVGTEAIAERLKHLVNLLI